MEAIWARIGGGLPILGNKVPIWPLLLAFGGDLGPDRRDAADYRQQSADSAHGFSFWGAIWARVGGQLPIIGDKVPILPLVLTFGGDLGPDRRAAADNRQ